jgi:hypothetical protein
MPWLNLDEEITAEFEDLTQGAGGSCQPRAWDWVFPSNGPAKGEDVSTAKLSEAEVLAIRAEYGRKGLSTLARKYRVSVVAVFQLVKGRTWQHLPTSTAQLTLWK